MECLCADPYVTDKKGIFEYVLGGCRDTKLLNVRVFDEATKRTVYTRQTEKAKQEGVSNCPLCAAGSNVNKTKIWKITEMDADHVKAWSKEGATDISNCEMLCITHNRAKGNGNARQSRPPPPESHERKTKKAGEFLRLFRYGLFYSPLIQSAILAFKNDDSKMEK